MLMDVFVCWGWWLLVIQKLTILVEKLFCAILGKICRANLKVTLFLIWFLIDFSVFPIMFLINVLFPMTV